jgi:hypothetical protein
VFWFVPPVAANGSWSFSTPKLALASARRWPPLIFSARGRFALPPNRFPTSGKAELEGRYSPQRFFSLFGPCYGFFGIAPGPNRSDRSFELAESPRNVPTPKISSMVRRSEECV